VTAELVHPMPNGGGDVRPLGDAQPDCGGWSSRPLGCHAIDLTLSRTPRDGPRKSAIGYLPYLGPKAGSDVFRLYSAAVAIRTLPSDEKMLSSLHFQP
jgi:hypothetical protein